MNADPFFLKPRTIAEIRDEIKRRAANPPREPITEDDLVIAPTTTGYVLRRKTDSSTLACSTLETVDDPIDYVLSQRYRVHLDAQNPLTVHSRTEVRDAMKTR
jgi:hypothetical protein